MNDNEKTSGAIVVPPAGSDSIPASGANIINNGTDINRKSIIAEEITTSFTHYSYKTRRIIRIF